MTGISGVPWLECQGTNRGHISDNTLVPECWRLSIAQKDSGMTPVKPGRRLSLGDGHSITCNPES